MDNEQKDGKQNKISISKLRLNTLQNVKKSLARLINESLKPESDLTRIRAAVYGTNILIAAYRIDFENRLEALEKIVEQK
jgi:hypothetical protein